MLPKHAFHIWIRRNERHERLLSMRGLETQKRVGYIQYDILHNRKREDKTFPLRSRQKKSKSHSHCHASQSTTNAAQSLSPTRKGDCSNQTQQQRRNIHFTSCSRKSNTHSITLDPFNYACSQRMRTSTKQQKSLKLRQSLSSLLDCYSLMTSKTRKRPDEQRRSITLHPL